MQPCSAHANVQVQSLLSIFLIAKQPLSLAFKEGGLAQLRFARHPDSFYGSPVEILPLSGPVRQYGAARGVAATGELPPAQSNSYSTAGIS